MREPILQPRDLEMLRTIARLRHVTTRELRTTFFPSDDTGRRRIKILSERDLIRSHNKGVDPTSTYAAWRLTQAGLERVKRHWPSEPIADGYLDSVTDGSLINARHREETSAIYFGFIRGKDTDDKDAQAACMNERANALYWHADGATVLRFNHGGKPRELVPDAVAVGRYEDVRCFIEVDRANKTLGRIRENLELYAHFLRSIYPTQFKRESRPCVVYVVPSMERCTHVADLCRQLLPANRWHVCVRGQTHSWLEEQLLGVRTPNAQSSEAANLSTASRQLMKWTSDLLAVLQQRGVFEPLKREESTFVNDGRARLIAVNEALERVANGK